MPTKHLQKHKLLLDEALPPKQRYLKLNNFHDIKHIEHDLKKGGSSDLDVYKLAIKENRILITFNIKDFKPMLNNKTPSIIALSPNLSNNEADLKICKLLKNIKLNQSTGFLISISRNEVVLK